MNKIGNSLQFLKKRMSFSFIFRRKKEEEGLEVKLSPIHSIHSYQTTRQKNG